MKFALNDGHRGNVRFYLVLFGVMCGWSCRSADSDEASGPGTAAVSPDSAPSRRIASNTTSPRKILGRWAPATMSRSGELEPMFDPPTGFQAIFEEFTEDGAAFAGFPEDAREASHELSETVVGRWRTYRMETSVKFERCFVVGRHSDGSMRMISVPRQDGRQHGASSRLRIEMLMNSEGVAALIILVDAIGLRDPELCLYLPIPSSATKAPTTNASAADHQ